MNDRDPIEVALRLAAGEAAAAGFSEITPAHLLIALSRLAEDDGDGQIDSDDIRREFEGFGIEPRRFRRRLRGVVDREQQPVDRPQDTRPSLECVAVFSRAQASLSPDKKLRPRHLVRAILGSLAGGTNVPSADEAEVQCASCGARGRPVLIDRVKRCASCGKEIGGSGPLSPTDAIPTEL